MCDGARREAWLRQTMGLLVLSALVATATGCYIFPSDVPNPCEGVTCGPGASCRPTADGRSYTCECPASCPSYGDHEGSRPLCGSDARDYPGDCEMRRAACELNTNITFKYYGKCDPCAGVTCPDPEVCQLDERRQPLCRCAEPCPLEFSPVCASDGKTYSNECQMHRESCRARKQLKVVFKGQCSSGVNPCAEVECRHGAECRVEAGAVAAGAVCACAAPCEPVLRPVCGSDARTHDSECELRRAACLLGREITVLHAGACGSNGVCAGRVCPHGGECVAAGAGARGVCRCPRCSNEFAPVCGSDGISYGNRCKLQLEACRHRRDVQVLYDGPCNGCENKKCEYYAVCESDGVSEASCVCPKHCEEGTETEEVCGNDNQTYSSLCALRDAACREKKHVHVKHMGSCESCAGTICPPGSWCARGACGCSLACADAAREPVCGSDGATYAHDCALQRAGCEARARSVAPPTVAYYGECEEQDEGGGNGSRTTKTADLANEIRSEDGESSSVTPAGAVCARVQCAFEATCAVDGSGQPRCACLFDCAKAPAHPVCASDLRLYPTLCHMKLEACRRQEDLRLRPLALCRGLEFRPCGEDEPLTDSEGRILDCGGGPHRKDCPVGSYCHHTAKAARCCKKDKSAVEKKGCQESWHGCCADGATPARGPGGAGCPSPCGCHRLGAKGDHCDESGQCVCRPGVGGPKCDRCEPGYWGLPRIGNGHTGCIPCGCSAFGSVREDCEQMTGRCVCKPGIQGQKCTVCSNHEHSLGPNGCFDPESTQLPATSCEHMTCYYGAYCLVRSGLATCECAGGECGPDGLSVCGSDGRTYLSACHLRTHACRTQADAVVQAFGPCGEAAPHVRREHTFSDAYTLKAPNTSCETKPAGKTFEPHVDFAEDLEMNFVEEDYSLPEDYADESDVYEAPLFDGTARMVARTRLPSKRFDIWAEVSAVCEKGALVSSAGARDHLWLGVVENRAVLHWNAGSGSMELRAGRLKTDGRTKVSARRYKKDAVLKVGAVTARGSAQGRMSSLDVDPYIYVGQPPENVTRLFGSSIPGFVGCVHRLRVSGRDVIPPSRGLPVTSHGLKPCTAHNLARLVCP